MYFHQSWCIADDGNDDNDDVQVDRQTDIVMTYETFLSLTFPKIVRSIYSRRQTDMSDIVFDKLNFVHSSVAPSFLLITF